MNGEEDVFDPKGLGKVGETSRSFTYAESTITGTPAMDGSISCLSRNCHPLTTGIIRSSRMTSGGSSFAFESASSPCSAEDTR